MARDTRARPGPATPRRTRADQAPDTLAVPDDATPQAMGLTHAPAPDGGTRSGAPVLVLTYGFAGGRRLQGLLSRDPDLACTARTGILAAVGQAAEAWQYAEDRASDRLSALATASVRALANAMLTVLTTRMGSRRWCETASVDPIAATAFLQAFPDTKIICLQRACPDVVYALLNASPWGLAGPGFAAYLASHPASNAAALCAWWADQAGPLLDLEAAYPRTCMRVRYEDLIADQGKAFDAICEFIGLSPQSDDAAPEPGADRPVVTGPEAPGCGKNFPVGQIPPLLIDRVNALLARLDYPLLSNS